MIREDALLRSFSPELKYRQPLKNGCGFELLSDCIGYEVQWKIGAGNGFPWLDASNHDRCDRLFVSQEHATKVAALFIEKGADAAKVRPVMVRKAVHQQHDDDFEHLHALTIDYPAPPIVVELILGAS